MRWTNALGLLVALESTSLIAGKKHGIHNKIPSKPASADHHQWEPRNHHKRQQHEETLSKYKNQKKELQRLLSQWHEDATSKVGSPIQESRKRLLEAKRRRTRARKLVNQHPSQNPILKSKNHRPGASSTTTAGGGGKAKPLVNHIKPLANKPKSKHVHPQQQQNRRRQEEPPLIFAKSTDCDPDIGALDCQHVQDITGVPQKCVEHDWSRIGGKCLPEDSPPYECNPVIEGYPDPACPNAPALDGVAHYCLYVDSTLSSTNGLCIPQSYSNDHYYYRYDRACNLLDGDACAFFEERYGWPHTCEKYTYYYEDDAMEGSNPTQGWCVMEQIDWSCDLAIEDAEAECQQISDLLGWPHYCKKPEYWTYAVSSTAPAPEYGDDNSGNRKMDQLEEELEGYCAFKQLEIDCNPDEVIDDPDLGILNPCQEFVDLYGVNHTCVPNTFSEQGGYCEGDWPVYEWPYGYWNYDNSNTLRLRDVTVFCSPYLAEMMPYIEDLKEIFDVDNFCDCSNFDYASLTGTLSCKTGDINDLLNYAEGETGESQSLFHEYDQICYMVPGLCQGDVGVYLYGSMTNGTSYNSTSCVYLGFTASNNKEYSLDYCCDKTVRGLRPYNYDHPDEEDVYGNGYWTEEGEWVPADDWIGQEDDAMWERPGRGHYMTYSCSDDGFGILYQYYLCGPNAAYDCNCDQFDPNAFNGTISCKTFGEYCLEPDYSNICFSLGANLAINNSYPLSTEECLYVRDKVDGTEQNVCYDTSYTYRFGHYGEWYGESSCQITVNGQQCSACDLAGYSWDSWNYHEHEYDYEQEEAQEEQNGNRQRRHRRMQNENANENADGHEHDHGEEDMYFCRRKRGRRVEQNYANTASNQNQNSQQSNNNNNYYNGNNNNYQSNNNNNYYNGNNNNYYTGDEGEDYACEEYIRYEQCFEFNCEGTDRGISGNTCDQSLITLVDPDYIWEWFDKNVYMMGGGQGAGDEATDQGGPPTTNTAPATTGELNVVLVTSGDLSQEEASAVAPVVLESMLNNSPNGFFSGEVAVDPSFSSEATPAEATDGTFSLETSFTPSPGTTIPSDLKYYVYDANNGLLASGPVNADGSFSLNVENLPSGKTLLLITFSSPSTGQGGGDRRQLARRTQGTTSIATTMTIWVQSKASATSAPTMSQAPSAAPTEIDESGVMSWKSGVGGSTMMAMGLAWMGYAVLSGL